MSHISIMVDVELKCAKTGIRVRETKVLELSLSSLVQDQVHFTLLTGLTTTLDINHTSLTELLDKCGGPMRKRNEQTKDRTIMAISDDVEGYGDGSDQRDANSPSKDVGDPI